MEKSIEIWSKLVRARDRSCAWCGKAADLQAHHIVSRAVSSTMGQLDLDNGMTLCFSCHIYRLKRDPDGYIEMRDMWLAVRGLTYQGLKDRFCARGKVTLSELKLLHRELENRLEKVIP